MMLLAQLRMASTINTSAPVPNFHMMIPVALIYGGMAVVFIWLGIGSIMARRWARALLLILTWVWLLIGIVEVIGAAVFLPKFFAIFANPSAGGQQIPDAARIIITIVVLVMISVMMVVLPGLLVLFYRSQHVKATCEARNPAPCWTDACPLPVLALSLMLGLGAISMLIGATVCRGVMPFFGRFISGAPGIILMLVIVAVWGYCACAIYRLKAIGWWIILVSHAVLMVSGALTFTRVDPIEMYRLMGYPQQQIQQMQPFINLFKSHMPLCMLLFVLPFFGYLLYVKKFFPKNQA